MIESYWKPIRDYQIPDGMAVKTFYWVHTLEEVRPQDRKHWQEVFGRPPTFGKRLPQTRCGCGYYGHNMVALAHHVQHCDNSDTDSQALTALMLPKRLPKPPPDNECGSC